jgi:hypothetical protein
MLTFSNECGEERVVSDSALFPVLDRPIEWDRFCLKCQAQVLFVATRFCANGLIGKCSGCGDERVAPFTRTNSEAA